MAVAAGCGQDDPLVQQEETRLVHAHQVPAQRKPDAQVLVQHPGRPAASRTRRAAPRHAEADRIIAVRAYFEGTEGPADQADLFFTRLLQDDIFSLGEGRVVAAFKQAAPGLIQGRTLDASPTEGYLLAV